MSKRGEERGINTMHSYPSFLRVTVVLFKSLSFLFFFFSSDVLRFLPYSIWHGDSGRWEVKIPDFDFLLVFL